jgi:hypothetical protein
MTREQFESSLVKAPDPGTAGEAVFDFQALPSSPCPDFRYSTVFEWTESGQAMEECWQAYLQEREEDWSE